MTAIHGKHVEPLRRRIAGLMNRTDFILNPYLCHSRVNGKIAIYNGLKLNAYFFPSWVVSFLNRLGKRPITAQVLDAMYVKWGPENYKRSIDEYYKFVINLILSGLLLPIDYDKSRYYRDINGHTPDVGISTLYLIVTTACNLNCSYCYIRDSLNATGTLPTKMTQETARNAIDLFCKNVDLRGEGPLTVVFYGGEPLLNFGLVRYAVQCIMGKKLAGAFLNKQISFQVVTNGAMLTEEIVDYCDVNGVNLGFSIDGSPSVNDSSRRCNDGTLSSYDAVIKAIKMAQKRKPGVDISFTIGKHNQESIEREIKHLNKNINIQSIYFNMPLLRRGSDKYADVLSPSDAATALGRALGCCLELGIRCNNLSRRLAAFVGRFPFVWVCNAVGCQMVVSPNGTLSPCQAVMSDADLSMSQPPGSVNLSENKLWQLFAARNTWNGVKCGKDCPLFLLCGSGCAYNALLNEGSVLGRDPFICLATEVLLQYYLTLYQENICEERWAL